jgi:acyl carrier protein
MQKEALMEDNKSKIRAFLSRSFPVLDLQDNDDIFARGFVNSLFAMQLVLFLEKDFEIEIENEDLDLDNFRTINAMTNLIERKLHRNGN